MARAGLIGQVQRIWPMEAEQHAVPRPDVKRLRVEEGLVGRRSPTIRESEADVDDEQPDGGHAICQHGVGSCSRCNASRGPRGL